MTGHGPGEAAVKRQRLGRGVDDARLDGGSAAVAAPLGARTLELDGHAVEPQLVEQRQRVAHAPESDLLRFMREAAAAAPAQALERQGRGGFQVGRQSHAGGWQRTACHQAQAGDKRSCGVPHAVDCSPGRGCAASRARAQTAMVEGSVRRHGWFCYRYRTAVSAVRRDGGVTGLGGLPGLSRRSTGAAGPTRSVTTRRRSSRSLRSAPMPSVADHVDTACLTSSQRTMRCDCSSQGQLTSAQGLNGNCGSLELPTGAVQSAPNQTVGNTHNWPGPRVHVASR